MQPAGTAPDRSGRRSFLARVVIGVQTAIGATVAFVVGGAALAPSFSPPRRTWLRAATLADLADGAPTPVTLRIIRQDGYRQVVDRRTVYVQRDGDGGVRVLDSTCTHLGCRTRYDAESKRFLCPCHGGVYDADGSVLDGPPPEPLRRMDARIDGDTVVVQV
jgi:menaquinol-cytochrome c reductase iron-sulfur subunit